MKWWLFAREPVSELPRRLLMTKLLTEFGAPISNLAVRGVALSTVTGLRLPGEAQRYRCGCLR